MIASLNDTAPPDELPSGPPATPRGIPFLEDPMTDHLVRAVVSLTMELSVTRERLRSLELVLADKHGNLAAQIDSLVIDQTESEERKAGRNRLIHSVLALLADEEK